MGKGRLFSDSSNDEVYQTQANNENYVLSSQSNAQGLGGGVFNDSSGYGNFRQSGRDQRKADLDGALFRGNLGQILQDGFIDFDTKTLNLLVDQSGNPVALTSTDRILIISGFNTTVDLVTILGAERPGQRLFIHGVSGNAITIKHTAGAIANTILTPGGVDFQLRDFEVVELHFDVTENKWRIIGDPAKVGTSGYTTIQDEGISVIQRSIMNFIGPGVTAVDNPGTGVTDITITGTGSGEFFGPWTAQHNAGGFPLVNLISLDIEDSAGATKLGISGPLGVGARFSFVAGDSVFFTEIITDRLKINADGLDVFAGDIVNVDRLQLSGGTASATSVNDVVWYLDSAGDLVSNVNATDGWIWSSGNVSKMILTDSTLEKRNGTAPVFQLFKELAPATGTAGTINIFAKTVGQPTAGKAMGFIVADTEVITGDGSGSLKFGVNQDGTATFFLTLNDGNSGQVDILKDLDMNTFDILNIDNARFVADSTIFPSDIAKSIILFNTSNQFQFNTAKTNDFVFSFDDNVGVIFDHDVTNPSTPFRILTVQSDSTDTNSTVRLDLIKTFNQSTSGQKIGQIGFRATDDTTPNVNLEYASIVGTIVDASIGVIDGSLGFEATIDGSATRFITINGTIDHNIDILKDLNMNTFDIRQIDRLRFVSSSGSVVSNNDPTILLDGVSNMVFNIADQKQFFWTNSNQSIMALDRDGVNNDTLLTIETDSSNASAIPFVNIFRDDPTPQSGLVGDSEITNLQFIGTNAATNGGASVGSNVYSKIVSIYESVITGREASSVNFFTSFDTGSTTQLKSFLGLNNSNSEEIEAFVDLNMSDNNINKVTDIVGRDDSTAFRIIFNSNAGNDTLIQSDTTNGDRIDFFADSKNVFITSWDTTDDVGLVGIPANATDKSLMIITNHALQFNKRTAPADGDLKNNEGFVYFDGASDPGILTIKKKNNVGAVSVVSLEAGGGSQTPWLQDIDADGFDLNDLSNIEFRTSTGVPAATVNAIFVQLGSLVHNVPTGSNYDFREQGANFLVMDAAVATFTSGTFQANSSTVNLGLNSTANVNVIGLSTFAANATLSNNVDIVPFTDNGSDLGDSTHLFENVFLSNIVLQTSPTVPAATKFAMFVQAGSLVLNTPVTATGDMDFRVNGANKMVLNATSLTISTNLIPSTATIDLGNNDNRFQNIHLHEGFNISKIIFGTTTDNDTYITGSGTEGRINIFSNGSNTVFFTTGGIRYADGLKQFFNPDGTNPGLNFGSQAGDPTTTQTGDVWYNSTTNKFRANENGSDVDMIGGGSGSQTPWLQDIDADGFDLKDLSNIEFRTSTGVPAAGTNAIFVQASSLVHNVPNMSNYDFRENGVNFLVMDAAVATFTVGTFQASSNVVNLGANSGDNIFLLGVSNFAAQADMNTNFLQFDATTAPANPPATERRLFCDSGNNDELSVRTSGGVTISLESGGGALLGIQDAEFATVHETSEFDHEIWLSHAKQGDLDEDQTADKFIALVPERILYYPFYIGKAGIINRIGVEVATGAANGQSFSVAVYDSISGQPYPNTRISGSFTGVLNQSGIVSAFVNFTLTTPGLYWIATWFEDEDPVFPALRAFPQQMCNCAGWSTTNDDTGALIPIIAYISSAVTNPTLPITPETDMTPFNFSFVTAAFIKMLP